MLGCLFVYITAGKGIYDSHVTGEIAVEAGSVFILFPGVWHRFRPIREAGWDEYWVECEGELLEAAIQRCGLNPSAPIIRVGHDDALLRCFLNIAETIEKEVPGFEPVIAMRSLEIVARIHSLMNAPKTEEASESEKIVKVAQLRMREAINKSLDFPALAHELGMSYSRFRRMFKKQTGYAPGEYFIAMRMNRAKQLLLTNRSIQEVANIMGFDSVYYFSRLFKSHTGISPKKFRLDSGTQDDENENG